MIIRKFFSIGFIIIPFFFLLNPSNSDTDIYSSTESLHIRSNPSINNESLSIISKGDSVHVLSKDNPMWFFVEYNGVTGYSRSSYLTPTVVNNDSTFGIFFYLFLFLILSILSGLFWRFRLLFSLLSFIFGLIGIQWLYLGEVKYFGVQMIGLITLDISVIVLWFVSIYSMYDMSKSDFDKLYNNHQSGEVVKNKHIRPNFR